ncbi:hypothetical protein [Nocardioides sambongensis]|uniref:hypothetical protein n=1 Tax=Nocardioides sambongensis TaxID=2589074 RepID=UPI00112BA081|nr:hypothetical protein [Nocardioides sambongensis]
MSGSRKLKRNETAPPVRRSSRPSRRARPRRGSSAVSFPGRIRAALGRVSGRTWGVAAAVLVLLVGAAIAIRMLPLGSEDTGPGAEQMSGPPVSTVDEGAPKDGAWDPYWVGSDTSGAAAEAAEEWEPVAERFTAGFLAGTEQGPWLKQLKPLTTPALLTRLRSVDSGRVPAGRAGAVELVSAGDNAVAVRAAVDDGADSWSLDLLLVELPAGGGNWRVYGYTKGA